MNRRTFIRLLGASAAVAAIDPERLLWEPGKKTIVDLHVPRLPLIAKAGAYGFQRGDIISFEGIFAINPHTLQPAGPKQFVVTSDVLAGDVVNLEPMLHPPIIERGPYANAVDIRKRGHPYRVHVFGERYSVMRPDLAVRVNG